MKPMVFWNVYLNGKEIDSVPYTPDCDKDYVLRSLIDHDGYDPAITVRRAPGQSARSKRSSPKTVYTGAGDYGCPVKIVERNGTFAIYRCSGIEVWPDARNPTHIEFKWESSPRERWNSKPYEDRDVSTNPRDMWSYASRGMCSHLIHVMVFPPGGRKRAAPEDDYDYRRSKRCTCAKK